VDERANPNDVLSGSSHPARSSAVASRHAAFSMRMCRLVRGRPITFPRANAKIDESDATFENDPVKYASATPRALVLQRGLRILRGFPRSLARHSLHAVVVEQQQTGGVGGSSHPMKPRKTRKPSDPRPLPGVQRLHVVEVVAVSAGPHGGSALFLR
jgi:hypothetical protein